MLPEHMLDMGTLEGLGRAALEARRYTECKPDHAVKIIERLCERCSAHRVSNFRGLDWQRHATNLEVAARMVHAEPMAARGALLFFHTELQPFTQSEN